MIDSHTHLHPPRLFAAIRRWFAEHSSWDIAHQPSEPRAIAKVMRDAGVERFIYCSYAHKPGMAAEVNAWLTATARELDGAGIPLLTVHPDDPDALGDARAALDAGCTGMKLHEDVQQIAVDDPRLAPVFALLAARGAHLMVHVGPIPWRTEPGAGVARVRNVLRDHPALNVVVAHMGVPDTAEYVALMDEAPRLHLDTTMVFATDGPMGERVVDRATLEARADRILYGTDFPNIPYPYGHEREGLERYGLSPGALQAILHDNAARLLKARA